MMIVTMAMTPRMRSVRRGLAALRVPLVLSDMVVLIIHLSQFNAAQRVADDALIVF
jgi:hypothetical protein